MKKYAITLLAASGLLITGCNQSIENASADFNKLPPEVQKTVRAQSPNGEIANVSKTTQNGMDIYEIKFKQPDGGTPKVEVAPDGRLISSDFPKTAGVVQKLLTPTGATGTKFSALPEAVQKTIQAKSPNAEISDISRHEKDGRVYYTVEFRDQGKNPTMQVGQDGTVVQDLQK
jgi:uncharacterized membrane protein YkoI